MMSTMMGDWSSVLVVFVVTSELCDIGEENPWDGDDGACFKVRLFSGVVGGSLFECKGRETDLGRGGGVELLGGTWCPDPLGVDLRALCRSRALPEALRALGTLGGNDSVVCLYPTSSCLSRGSGGKKHEQTHHQ